MLFDKISSSIIFLANDTGALQFAKQIAQALGVSGDNMDSLTLAIIKQVTTIIGLIGSLGVIATEVVNTTMRITLNTDGKLGDGWEYSIFFVNVIAIFILLAIALANALKINIETYAIKKTLPALIIGFILANLSMLISKFVLDFADILVVEINRLFPGQGDLSLIESLLKKTTGVELNGDTPDTIMAMINNFATGSGRFAKLNEIIQNMGGQQDVSKLILIILLLFIAFFYSLPHLIMIALAFVVIARQIIVFILVVLAPLGIMLYAFQPSRSLGQKWLSSYLTWIFVLPVIFFVLGLANVLLPDSTDAAFNMDIFTFLLDDPAAQLVYGFIAYLSGIFVLVFALLLPMQMVGFGNLLTSAFTSYLIYGYNPLSRLTTSGMALAGISPELALTGQGQGTQPPPMMTTQPNQLAPGVSPMGGQPQTTDQKAESDKKASEQQQATRISSRTEQLSDQVTKPSDRKEAKDNQTSELLKSIGGFRDRMKDINKDMQSGLAKIDSGKDSTTVIQPGPDLTKVDEGRPITTPLSNNVVKDSLAEQLQYSNFIGPENSEFIQQLEQANSYDQAQQIINKQVEQGTDLTQINQSISQKLETIRTESGQPIQTLSDLVRYNQGIQQQASQNVASLSQGGLPTVDTKGYQTAVSYLKKGDMAGAVEAASRISPELTQIIKNDKSYNFSQSIMTLNGLAEKASAVQQISAPADSGSTPPPAYQPPPPPVSSITPTTSTPAQTITPPPPPAAPLRRSTPTFSVETISN